MMNIRGHIGLLFAAVMLFLFACSDSTDVAGGSATDVGNTISGVIKNNMKLEPGDDRSNRAADATVQLLPQDYNPREPGNIPGEWTVTTDGRGEYLIKKVTTGSYNIQASFSEDNTLALIQDVEVTEYGKRMVEADTSILRKPGRIAVSLFDLPVDEGGYLYLPGTDVFTMIDVEALRDGYVTFDAVPAGTFTDLNYEGDNTGFQLDIQQGLEVNPSETVDLGTVIRGAVVSGRVVDSRGNVASSVIVRLVPQGFNPLTGEVLADTLIRITGSDGGYSFNGISSGTYRLEAVDLDGGRKVIIQDIEVTEEVNNLSDAVLESSGTMVLHIPDSIAESDGYIYIPGTSIWSMVAGSLDADNYVTFTGIPAGTYESVLFSEDAEATETVVLFSNVSVEPGMSVFLNYYHAWSRSTKISVNTSSSGADISDRLLDFPLLVRLSGSEFPFEQADTKGKDIRFTNRHDEPLPYEIENWDNAGQEAEIWIKVDTVLGGSESQYITMYWGNQGAESESDGTAVFTASNSYEGVWHMHQDPGTAAPQLPDASESGNHAIAYEMSSGDRSDAVISKGITLNGNDQYISTSKAYVNPLVFSLSLWFNTSTDRGGKLIGFGRDHVGITEQGYDRHVWMDSTGLLHFGVFPQSREILSSDVSYNDGDWHHIYAELSSVGQFFYVDGELITLDSSVTSAQNLVGVWRIGADNLNTWEYHPASLYFNGKLDEVRVQYSGNSRAWVKMCYENQKPNSTVVEIQQ